VFRRFGVPSWAAANDSSDARPATRGTVIDYPSSPGPDPDSMIILRISPETSGDVFLMSLTGAFEPKPLIVSPAYEGGPQLLQLHDEEDDVANEAAHGQDFDREKSAAARPSQ
jgi:hypothetical protein